MFARWLGDGAGGMRAAVQRKALQSSVQECEYHLGWSKSHTLDVIRSLHCTNGKTEAQGS